jgi:serine/threonine-protein kinase RsbW
MAPGGTGRLGAVSDQVVIRIPATIRHLKLVTATATSLAGLLDFTYDRLMDLHIAIDEVCSRIMATSVPPATRLEVTFELEGGALRISARGDSPLGGKAPFLTSWAKTILDQVTDDIEVGDEDGKAFARFSVARG